MGRFLVSLVVRFAAEVGPVLRSRPALVAIGLLLALDAGFVLVHVAHVLATHHTLGAQLGIEGSILSDPRFSLERDGGYPELFEYGKTAVCVLALGGCWALTRQPIYAALAAVFGLTLADNAVQLHETWGVAVSDLLQGAGILPPGARSDLGELAVFAAEGAAALAVLLLGFRGSAARHRLLGLAFVLLLLVLAGFSVGVDLLHAALMRVRGMERLLGTVEDGGEFVVLSAACTLSVALCARLAAERRSAAWPRAATAGAVAAMPARGLPGGGGRSRGLARDARAVGYAAIWPAGHRPGFGSGEVRDGGG